MKASLSLLLVLIFSLPVLAADSPDWKSYMRTYRYVCPAPFAGMTPVEIKLGAKTYIHTGSTLKVKGQDADKSMVIGIVSAVKDVSAATKKNLHESVAWFKASGVEWVVANGDLALEEFDLEEVLTILASSKLPVLAVPGNSESVGSFHRSVRAASGEYPNIVDGVWVRRIVADDVEFWTLPGYFDKRFLGEDASCRYDQKDTDLLAQQKAEGDRPVVLVSHGPPKGKGRHAIDRISDRKNVGDTGINKVLKDNKISYGIFGHILEAGGRGVAGDQKTPVAPKKVSKTLHLNAGSLSGDPWPLLSGKTGYGIAMIMRIDENGASYEVKYFPHRPE
ncbi:metallophosphoesterase [Myxococcota bacterium]|nr:metallophosphoesterase [Myxococcota bacterium]